jgi:hypothetical protein
LKLIEVIKTNTIYVELLEEGTTCWRPVNAEQVDGELYRVVGKKPEDEVWPFSTGDIVKCKKRTFQSGLGLLAHEKSNGVTISISAGLKFSR